MFKDELAGVTEEDYRKLDAAFDELCGVADPEERLDILLTFASRKTCILATDMVNNTKSQTQLVTMMTILQNAIDSYGRRMVNGMSRAILGASQNRRTKR